MRSPNSRGPGSPHGEDSARPEHTGFEIPQHEDLQRDDHEDQEWIAGLQWGVQIWVRQARILRSSCALAETSLILELADVHLQGLNCVALCWALVCIRRAFLLLLECACFWRRHLWSCSLQMFIAIANKTIDQLFPPHPTYPNQTPNPNQTKSFSLQKMFNTMLF